MVNLQSLKKMNESCLEPSVTSGRFSADRERFGGGRGGLSPNVGLPGPLVSGSPGTSGPLGNKITVVAFQSAHLAEGLIFVPKSTVPNILSRVFFFSKC